MRKKSVWLILTAAVALGSFSAGCTESLAEEEVIIEQKPEEMMGLSEDIPEIPEISDASQTAPGEEETDESEAAPAELTEPESPEETMADAPKQQSRITEELLVEEMVVLESAAEQNMFAASGDESSAGTDYTYRELPDGTVEITDYTGDLTADMRLEIPETLDGKTVTSLGKEAFHFLDSLREVVIPNTVTAIGVSCFENCGALESVTLPENVTSIGEAAFRFCRSLRNLALPQKLSTIGAEAFSGCTAITEVQIPESVTNIGVKAFSDCTGLTGIRFPDSLERVESLTFSDCYSLEYVVLPKNLKRIDSFAFSYCELLEEITFPASLEYIGPQIFRGCTLKKVWFEGKVPEMEHGENELRSWFADSAADGTYTGYIYVMHQYWSSFSDLRKEMSYAVSPPVEMAIWDTDTPHVWDAGKVYSQPTCMQEGTVTYTCTVCGEEKTEKLAASGEHRYSMYVTVQEATALTEGVRARTCIVCGYTETETVAKLTPTISLNVKTVPLKTGQSTTKVKVTGLAEGDSVVSWKSDKPKIVKVNGNGKLTAGKKTGTVKVTVTLASGLTETINVKVQKKDVATKSISGIKKKVTLKKKQKLILKPELVPVTSTDKVKYASSNSKVATVSAKGVVKAKSKGKTTITVKAGKKTVKCKVTVK